MNVFYSTDIINNKIILRDQEAQHCTKVLRKGRGEQIHIIDGKGSRYTCEIIEQKRTTVELIIISSTYNPPNLLFPHLAFGLIKNQTRLEWMLEKITEIGVGRITPLICQRSERSTIKYDRIKKIIVSATKQSLHHYIPAIDQPIPYAAYIASTDRTKKYVASLHQDAKELATVANRHQPSVILIGPEGDFSEDEIKHALEKGYTRVNLGSSRLRAETACIVSLTLLGLG